MMRLLAALALASISCTAAAADKVTAPVPVTPPLWQGTPYISSTVVLGANCESFAAIPAGMVLFITRVQTDFNVKAGGTGSAGIYLTPLGGTQQLLDLPVWVSSRAQQVAGIYDGYAATLEIGMPTASALSGCFFAGAEDDIAGSFTVFGFLLPAS